MRVDIVDPPAYSPAYDDALAAALAALGADVHLLTSEFAYGEPPAACGYVPAHRFYRHARGPAGSRLRAMSKRAEHLPDMLAYRRRAGAEADVVHFQWLTVPRLDLWLLPDVPVVLTIHDPLERGHRGPPLPARAFKHVNAVVVHTHHARTRVIAEHGLEPERVHVIPHGALTTSPAAAPAGPQSPVRLPAELVDDGSPVVLCFGLLRPYKGVETLLAAWRGIGGAQLWIVGRPMMDLAALRVGAPETVRFVPRFASRAEEQALFERADLVVLPYERSDRFGFSGVLATALGHGRAIVLSDVDGLREVATSPDPAGLGDPPARPAGDPPVRLVPPGDSGALHAALAELLADPDARTRLAAAAKHAASTTHSWERSARLTLELYARITA